MNEVIWAQLEYAIEQHDLCLRAGRIKLAEAWFDEISRLRNLFDLKRIEEVQAAAHDSDYLAYGEQDDVPDHFNQAPMGW